MSRLQCDASTARSSSTYATPFDMPAPKFRPTGPSTTTMPPVMYSQQWSPAPSITARAPGPRHAAPAAGHVLAVVAPRAFDHGERARVPDGEPVTGGAGREQPARRRAAERRVAADHV